VAFAASFSHFVLLHAEIQKGKVDTAGVGSFPLESINSNSTKEADGLTVCQLQAIILHRFPSEASTLLILFGNPV